MLAIVNVQTVQVEGTCSQSDLPYSGRWGDVTVFQFLEIPEGLDPQCLMATRTEGDQITLTEDPAKVQTKVDAQWTQVRAQQRQKLYESDWTCSVIDYVPPNRDAWITYRQALRDVTLQTDPFNIEWPSKPIP